MPRQSAQTNLPLLSSSEPRSAGKRGEQTFRLWQRAHSAVGSKQSFSPGGGSTSVISLPVKLVTGQNWK